MFTSAPFVTSSFTIPLWPLIRAACNGVSPVLTNRITEWCHQDNALEIYKLCMHYKYILSSRGYDFPNNEMICTCNFLIPKSPMRIYLIVCVKDDPIS